MFSMYVCMYIVHMWEEWKGGGLVFADQEIHYIYTDQKGMLRRGGKFLPQHWPFILYFELCMQKEMFYYILIIIDFD